MTTISKKSSIAHISVLIICAALIIFNLLFAIPKTVFAVMAPFLFLAVVIALETLIYKLCNHKDLEKTLEICDYHTMYTLTR